MDASVSVAVTATNAFDRIRGAGSPPSLSVTGAATIAATAAFIARMEASASVAVTATNVAGRIRGMSASASVAVTESASYVVVLTAEATVVSRTASGATIQVFSMPATGTL